MAGKRWDFLINKIKKNNYTVGAEVGVQAGQTFKRILNDCPDVTLYGIDVWVADKNVRLEEKELQGSEFHPNYNMLKHWIKSKKDLAERAIMVRSYSDGCLDQFEDNSLDFVFIDADHRYEGVRMDTLNWSKKVREGGLVAGHDYNMPAIKKWLDEITNDFSLQSEVGLDTKINYTTDNVWWYHKRQW